MLKWTGIYQRLGWALPVHAQCLESSVMMSIGRCQQLCEQAADRCSVSSDLLYLACAALDRYLGSLSLFLLLVSFGSAVSAITLFVWTRLLSVWLFDTVTVAVSKQCV
jgi:hypothetical protein